MQHCKHTSVVVGGGGCASEINKIRPNFANIRHCNEVISPHIEGQEAAPSPDLFLFARKQQVYSFSLESEEISVEFQEQRDGVRGRS